MADQNEMARSIEAPVRAEGFLDVFVVRSFRGSHLQSVVGAINKFIKLFVWGRSRTSLERGCTRKRVVRLGI